MNTYEDYIRDQALEDLHYQAVMERALIEQCIYLLVEGDSEERTFDELLLRSNFDIKEFGIVIANYNGVGNLKHALRLLNKTLSLDRPVVVTYDNDLEGKQILSRFDQGVFEKQNIFFFKIPSEPIVTFKNNHEGGSFEEMFHMDTFLSASFSKAFSMTPEDDKNSFNSIFDPTRPWYNQVKNYYTNHGKKKSKYNKVELSSLLLDQSESVPKTIIDLSQLLRVIREENPVIDPNDVDLPEIPGLTY